MELNSKPNRQAPLPRRTRLPLTIIGVVAAAFNFPVSLWLAVSHLATTPHQHVADPIILPPQGPPSSTSNELNNEYAARRHSLHAESDAGHLVAPTDEAHIATVIPQPTASDTQPTLIRETDNSSPVALPRPRNLSLVYIGDSISRHHYFSLAYFLRHGQWYNPRQEQLLFQHKAFESIYNYINYTNQLLTPFEVCDCFHDQTLAKDKEMWSSNRYFHDAERNNTLVYIQALGTLLPMRGRLDSGAVLQDFDRLRGIPSLSPMIDQNPKSTNHNNNSETKVLWEWQDWSDLVRHVVAPIKADAVVLNAGLWGSEFLGSNENIRALVDALETSGIKRWFWRTTSYKRGGGLDAATAAVDRKVCERLPCLDLSWSKHVRWLYHSDPIHFWEPFYRISNEQTLKTLGALPRDYVALSRQTILKRIRKSSQ